MKDPGLGRARPASRKKKWPEAEAGDGGGGREGQRRRSGRTPAEEGKNNAVVPAEHRCRKGKTTPLFSVTHRSDGERILF